MTISRVVLYARVSRKDKGQDTENQVAQLREFCAKQNWTITKEYVDQVSGKTHKRTEFQAMLAAASRHEFDLVLFWSLDRFSREGVLPTLKHLEVITSYGVAWQSYTEQYFDSCGIFRDAIISIAATLAKQERVKISERTIAGLERARKQGRFGGRPHRVVDRQLMRRLREEGRSFREIANEVGVSAMTAARILKTA